MYFVFLKCVTYFVTWYKVLGRKVLVEMGNVLSNEPCLEEGGTRSQIVLILIIFLFWGGIDSVFH